MTAAVTFLVMVAVTSRGAAAGTAPFEFSAYEIESMIAELHSRIERLEKAGLTSVRIQAEQTRAKLLDAISAGNKLAEIMG